MKAEGSLRFISLPEAEHNRKYMREPVPKADVALAGLRHQRRFGPLLQGWVWTSWRRREVNKNVVIVSIFPAYVLITLIQVVASAWVSNIVGNLSGYYMPTPRVVSRRAMCC